MTAVPTATRTNPFPGLRSFEPDEDHLFFGREKQVDELLEKLRRTRFLAVVGTSGSGKSSLIRSGLVPALHSGTMVRAGSSWRVAICRPGEDPIGHLAAELARPDVLAPEDADEAAREMHLSFLEATLRRGDLGLVEGVRQAHIPGTDNVVVIVDQFEELIRFKATRRLEDAAEASLAFVKLLLAAAAQDEVPIYVVVTMRSDFIGHSTEFPGFTEAINEGQYLVPRMTRRERRQAIVGPVAVGGAEISPRLVTRLLNDVGDDPDQLPILQHALMRTWDYWLANHTAGDPLDLHHYEAVGTLKEALSLHAEEAYQELDEGRQAIAERMFKTLTDQSSERGVRSPRQLTELTELTGATAEEVIAVIERFRLPGRTFLMPPASVPLAGDSIVDISHESLMRVWKRLRRWGAEDARSAQLYQRLAKAAARYQEGRGGLWHDPDLQMALNWRRQTRPTALWAQRYDSAFERAMLFLDTSREHRDRELRRRERQRRRQLSWARRMALIMGAAALATTFLGLYALDRKTAAEEAHRRAEANRQNAERERQNAMEQALLAEKRRREAVSQQQIADTERREAEAQRRIAETERGRAETQRQRAVAGEQAARSEKQKADAARDSAEQAQVEAERQQAIAVREKTRAEDEEAKARRLSRLALARALAAQSLRWPEDQQELAALLAVQAFRLHHEAGGAPREATVYAALHQAWKRLARDQLPTTGAHRDAVRVLALAPDGHTLLAGDDDGSLRQLDLNRPEDGSVELARLPAEVRSMAWSAGGRYLAAGDAAGSIHLLDRDGDAATRSREAPGGGVNALVFAGSRLVSAAADGTVRLWQDRRLETATELLAAGPRVTALALAGDGHTLAAGREQGGILLWDLRTLSPSPPGPPPAPPRPLGGERDVRSLVFIRDRLAAGTGDGLILLRTPDGAAAPIEIAGHSAPVVAMSAGRDLLASASLDGSVRLWPLAGNAGDAGAVEPIVLREHGDWVWSVVLTPDGERVVSGGADRAVRVNATRMPSLVEGICSRLSRSLSAEEWGEHLPAIDPRRGCPEPGAMP
ncbi:MAG: hypothetical protein GY856_12645 [bacterium]|nr:hypothetical protein [bacterium]